jgi:hypothetical protein
VSEPVFEVTPEAFEGVKLWGIRGEEHQADVRWQS